MAATYAGATALAGRLGRRHRRRAERSSRTRVVPIAVGYAIAHYFSLLLLDGQLTWILLSDPFGTGANSSARPRNAVDLTAVSPRTISVVQVDAIVIGHVLGVVLAHDRAVRLAAAGRGRARVGRTAAGAHRAVPAARRHGGASPSAASACCSAPDAAARARQRRPDARASSGRAADQERSRAGGVSPGRRAAS